MGSPTALQGVQWQKVDGEAKAEPGFNPATLIPNAVVPVCLTAMPVWLWCQHTSLTTQRHPCPASCLLLSPYH